MVFTNDDLKRLKAFCDRRSDDREAFLYSLNLNEAKALLARLEADEAVLEAIDRNDGWCAEAERLLHEARKAAGK